LLRLDSIEIVPVLRQKLRFAEWVWEALRSGKYDVLAIAWPRFLREKALEAASQLPTFQVLTVEESQRDLYYLLPFDPSDPFALGMQTALAMEIPIVFTDHDLETEADEALFFADDEPVLRLGLDRFREVWRAAHPKARRRDIDPRSAQRSAAKLREAAGGGKRVLFLCEWDQAEEVLAALKGPETPVPATSPGPVVRLYRSHPASIKWISSEIPYVVSRWVDHLDAGTGSRFDRIGALSQLVREARGHAPANSADSPPPLFSRRLGALCALHHRLVPGLGEIMQAAQELTNPAFSWQLYKLATRYFRQGPPGETPTLELGADFFGQASHPLRPPPEGGASPAPHRPLAAQLKRWKSKRIPLIRRNKAGAAVSLRRRLRALLAHARLRGAPVTLGDPLRLVLVFEATAGFQYPWKGIQAARMPRDGHLAFYATHPVSEEAFPRDARLSFGAFGFTTAAALPPDPFLEDPDAPFPGLNDAERLLWSLAQGAAGSAVTWIHDAPPSESMVQALNRNGVYLVHVDSAALPRSLLRPLRSVHSLGWARARRLMGKL